MSERVLSLRELNRATLARQMLLQREAISPRDAVERLLGLQAQIPNPPYIGLWTRLEGFERKMLTRLMEDRKVVRAALMRSTLHLMTSEDHQQFRTALQPALEKALSAFFGRRGKGLDIARLVEVARAALSDQPCTTGELKARLLEIEPERDGDALAYAVRAYLPLIQVPPGGTWGSGSTGRYTMGDLWLGSAHDEKDQVKALFLRYLAAFGPASVMDFQTWLGRTKLKEALEPVKGELRMFRDEAGRELFDLPDQPLPPGDSPAPVRFIPEYDNLLLAHDNRTRVIADEYRTKVFLSAARVRSTYLIDGFVQGAWKIEKAKNKATLVIEPFAPLSAADRDALAAEGERLARFIEDKAETVEIRFE